MDNSGIVLDVEEEESEDIFISGDPPGSPRRFSNSLSDSDNSQPLEIPQGFPPVKPCDSTIETCMICFEPLSNYGVHQICSLPCGHIYGISCITQWLDTKQKCPHCGRRQPSASVIPLFINSTVVVDNSRDIEWIKKLKKSERERKKALKRSREFEQRLSELERRYRTMNNRYSLLCNTGVQLVNNNDTSPETIELFQDIENHIKLKCMKKFNEAKFIKIKDNTNTSIDSSSFCSEYLVGHSKSYLSIYTLGRNDEQDEIKILGQQTEKLVKDACFFRTNNLVLSVGFGKTCQITNYMNNSAVADVKTTQPIWSCAVDRNNDCMFYCGYGNGKLEQFDTRYLEGPVSMYTFNDNRPIHSMSMSSSNHLLVTTFNRNYLVDVNKNDLTYYDLETLFEESNLKPTLQRNLSRSNSSDNNSNSSNENASQNSKKIEVCSNRLERENSIEFERVPSELLNNHFFDSSGVFDGINNDYFWFSTRKNKRGKSIGVLYKGEYKENKYDFTNVRLFDNVFEHNLYFSKGIYFSEFNEEFICVGDERDKRAVIKSIKGDLEFRLVKHKTPILDVKYIENSMLCLSGERLDIYELTL
eukprot:GAHX01001161.1.p1 GENE.GAHX01001161.1~~GAHX01001161.1.p1  ORF type:complete len:587 (-),score=116.17 GAHX01001161.1:47-1807(-)